MKKDTKIQNYKRNTSGFRNRKRVKRKKIYKGRPYKKLTLDLKKRSGINSKGRRVLRRTNGAKKLYRIIDFKRTDFENKFKVERIEYDPNRSAYITLVRNINKNDDVRYFLAYKDIKIGDIMTTEQNFITKTFGTRTFISNFQNGDNIYNIELEPNKGGILVRGAGTSAIILSSQQNFITVQLPSKEIRIINKKCLATYGVLSNDLHNVEIYGKASYWRYKGWKPRASAKTKNPCDHPMGGGHKNLGRRKVPRSRTGVLSKGGRTRKNKITKRFIVKHKWEKKKKKK